MMANNDENTSKNDVEQENIVLTPVKKTSKSTFIKIERLKRKCEEFGNTVHIAGGDHKGIVINKEANVNDDPALPPNLTLDFKVFLVNQQNNMHCQEKRGLRFWFKPDVNNSEYTRLVQEFFKSLVSPNEFPRDYIGFIKKIMKLMQLEYTEFSKIGVEITQLENTEELSSHPFPMDESVLDTSVEVTVSKVLELIESSYPNPLTIRDMAKHFNGSEEEIQEFVNELESKNLVRVIETKSGKSYIRIVQNEEDVKVVKHMPAVVSEDQPTIAIITSQYCEKLAVDAMIENRDVYVRYTTVGDSHVYTLGNIGTHRVVATKLPTIGHSRAAIIATGSTTTRLLGCFQKVEHVILVGVAGGVPNYADYSSHVRLGDIVVSSPLDNKKNYIFAYCDEVNQNEVGIHKFSTKTWCPSNPVLQVIARSLIKEGCNDEKNYEVIQPYFEEGVENLTATDTSFEKPPAETDRLYMLLGEKDVIEVNHPEAPEGSHHVRKEGCPKIHFGAIGSGRHVVKSNLKRQEFADQFGVIAMDHEVDAVVESIFGNRKDSYIFIRGISDYRDGTSGKEWQPYSSLLAASLMKAIIAALPAIDID